MEIIISKLLKGTILKILPPAQRYFTYIFIVIGIIWMGSANYYYFAEEDNKFQGALISGLAFFVLAIISKIWEKLILKKELQRDMLEDIVSTFYPLIGMKILNFLKDQIKNKKLPRVASVGAILVAVYFILRKYNKGK